MGLTTLPFVVVLVVGAAHAELAQEAAGLRRRFAADGRVPVGSADAVHEDRGRHPRRLRRGGRRRGVARAGREVAEAPDARPRQLHPVPRVRRRLPVELHLDDVDRDRRRAPTRRPRAPRSRARTRSSWSTTTRARGARSAWTGARRTPCTMRACPRARAGDAPWPRSPPRRRPTREREVERHRGEDEVRRRPRDRRARPRDRGLEVDLPSGLDLPPRLQGHLARPRARHDEQRAVPPAPHEGEAARAEADLHVLPGRAVASSCSSC